MVFTVFSDGILEFFPITVIPAFLGGISRENSHRGIYVWDRGPTSPAISPVNPCWKDTDLMQFYKGKLSVMFSRQKLPQNFG